MIDLVKMKACTMKRATYLVSCPAAVGLAFLFAAAVALWYGEAVLRVSHGFQAASSMLRLTAQLPFCVHCSQVFDEADRMFDVGFRRLHFI